MQAQPYSTTLDMGGEYQSDHQEIIDGRSRSDALQLRNDEFAARVLFIATKVAQMVASEDPATEDNAIRVEYAGRVIRGSDNPKMIATQVIALPIQQFKLRSMPIQPSMAPISLMQRHIEFALSSIWTARAKAFEEWRMTVSTTAVKITYLGNGSTARLEL